MPIIVHFPELIADSATYGSLVLGSPMRLLTLELIFETIFDLFLPTPIAKVLGWVFAGVGFPVETGLEYEGIETLFKKVLWAEEPMGHASYLGARITANLAATVQALIFTLPLGVLSLQVCDLWFGSSWWMLLSIPFLAPEFGAQLDAFHKTYNEKVATASTNYAQTRRAKKGLEPKDSWKRDWIIQFITKAQNDISSMPPELLQRVKKASQLF